MQDFKVIAKEVLELEAKELLNAAHMIGDEMQPKHVGVERWNTQGV